MAFTYEVLSTRPLDVGAKATIYGSYTLTSPTTTGEIQTGLSTINMVMFTQNIAGVSSGSTAVEETLPKAGGDFTMHADTDTTGYWMAIGS